MNNWGPIDPKELLAAIHEVTSDVIYLFDLETQSNVYISKSIAESIGYSPEEVKKMGAKLLETILHPEDLARVPEDQKTLRNLKDGEVYHTKSRFKKADGGILYLESRQMVYSRNKKGDAKLILGVTHDVTKLEKNQGVLRDMAAIAQKTTNAILITNLEENIEWVNEGYENLTGYTREEMIGRKPNVLMREVDENRMSLKEMRTKVLRGESFHGELVSYKKTGEEFWVRINADPLMNERGEADRYIFIAQNITELKQNEYRLLKSYERLKQYAFFTSHQLRAPVADILSILDVYNYDSPTDPDNLRLLEDLKMVSNKLDDAIHELSDIISADKVQFAEDAKQNKKLEKVLMVDDDRIFINITGMILKRYSPNIEIESYTNPKQGLEHLKSLPEMPDAIFLDINMPEMNGWDFLEKLAEFNTSTDVYMLTSSIDPADIQKSKTFSNVKGYFTKPLTQQTLADYFGG